MADIQQQLQNLENLLADFLDKREQAISSIIEIANKIDENHKNVNITKVVTSSSGIAGTVLGIAGLALAIPTGGISTLLTIGGIGLAVTSGAAHLGSDITEHFLTESNLKKLDEICQADETNIFRLADYLEIMVHDIKKNNSSFDNKIDLRIASSIIQGVSSLTNLTCSIIRITRATCLSIRTVPFTSVASLRLAGATSVVLGAVTLPFQIIDLALSGQALHEKESSDISIKLRQLAQHLKIQAENIVKYIFEMIHSID
ncbi:unnamed protein product [Rotaria sp. Silwood1]|nr:unnamed protein product [Rotaria sp. Silwood1]CAF1303548.1 unnamed protein product [Rotaria sp. Silwood1]CAF3529084.1 unnamed protein product [Rotaria sp. Silwood1]CAF4569237.1 unnamed protein product [Rotaria sp. Silwood1]CAF4808489.1 unnamed protein product [Rotaria sp. Silwood1]